MAWIISEGTQVVSQIDIRNPQREVVRPRGSVGIVVYAPSDDTHLYRVRFPDGEVLPILAYNWELGKSHLLKA